MNPAPPVTRTTGAPLFRPAVRSQVSALCSVMADRVTPREGNHSRWWLRVAAAPADDLGQQAVDAGLRQADDLLPAHHVDAGWGHRHPGDHHADRRSEEHTSELQTRGHLVCRLLLE